MRFQGGSWQTVLAGCQPQRQFGVLLLLAPAVAPRWGLEKTALFWNPEPRGKLELRVESRVPIGNSDVTVKYATVHSWVPYLTAEAWNRILFEIRKKECIGLNFRKCPNDEIWEMANVHNKGSGRRPKTWVIQNHVGDITGKKLREKGPFLVGSPWTTPAPPSVIVAHFSEHLTEADFQTCPGFFYIIYRVLRAQINHSTSFLFSHVLDIIISSSPSSETLELKTKFQKQI